LKYKYRGRTPKFSRKCDFYKIKKKMGRDNFCEVGGDDNLSLKLNWPKQHSQSCLGITLEMLQVFVYLPSYEGGSLKWELIWLKINVLDHIYYKGWCTLVDIKHEAIDVSQCSRVIWAHFEFKILFSSIDWAKYVMLALVLSKFATLITVGAKSKVRCLTKY
jgi:hypothetical protein